MAKATRHRYTSFNYPNKKFKWRSLFSLVLVSSVFLISAKDFFHFDNGRGGNDWKIGSPKINILNAHQPRSLADNKQLALRLVNRDRQLNGLTPLVEDTLLSQTAQLHAEDMLKRNYYAHITPEGKTPSDRFAQLGGSHGVGENIIQLTGATGIVLNYSLIEQFHKSWMYSQGHRQNLLKPDYTRIGYGIVADPMTGRVYAVQNFSSP